MGPVREKEARVRRIVKMALSLQRYKEHKRTRWGEVPLVGMDVSVVGRSGCIGIVIANVCIRAGKVVTPQKQGFDAMSSAYFVNAYRRNGRTS